MAELAVQFRPMIDGFGSHITYIRLSVTDRCDLRCRYCMDEAMQLPPREDNAAADLAEAERHAGP